MYRANCSKYVSPPSLAVVWLMSLSQEVLYGMLLLFKYVCMYISSQHNSLGHSLRTHHLLKVLARNAGKHWMERD